MTNELEIFSWGFSLVSSNKVRQNHCIMLKNKNKVIINKWLFKLIKDGVVDYTEILKLMITRK